MIDDETICDISKRLEKLSAAYKVSINAYYEKIPRHDGVVIDTVVNLESPFRIKKHSSGASRKSYEFTCDTASLKVDQHKESNGEYNYEIYFKKGTVDDFYKYILFVEMFHPEIFEDSVSRNRIGKSKKVL